MQTYHLNDFTNGWFYGNFDPAICYSQDTEVGYRSFLPHRAVDKHFHTVATEINVVVAGKMLINGQEMGSGDIFVLQPYDVSDAVFLEPTSLVVVKTPSIPGDKTIVEDFDIEYGGKKLSIELHSIGSIGPIFIRPAKKFYEQEMLTYIAQQYPKHGTILDAGAHCGNHILFYANFLKYDQIIGLEPNPESFCLLKRNVSKLEHVTIIPKGLWSSYALGTIHRYQIEPGCTSVSPDDEDSFKQELITIDSLDLKNVTLMKLDMEGPEYEALLGGEETILRDRPLLFVEISPNGNEHFPVNYQEIKDLLESWGYTQKNQWYDHIMYEFVPNA